MIESLDREAKLNSRNTLQSVAAIDEREHTKASRNLFSEFIIARSKQINLFAFEARNINLLRYSQSFCSSLCFSLFANPKSLTLNFNQIYNYFFPHSKEILSAFRLRLHKLTSDFLSPAIEETSVQTQRHLSRALPETKRRDKKHKQSPDSKYWQIASVNASLQACRKLLINSHQ